MNKMNLLIASAIGVVTLAITAYTAPNSCEIDNITGMHFEITCEGDLYDGESQLQNLADEECNLYEAWADFTEGPHTIPTPLEAGEPAAAWHGQFECN